MRTAAVQPQYGKVTLSSTASSSNSQIPAPTEHTPLIMSSSAPSITVSPRRRSVWEDIRTHRRAYVLTAVASFGGMLFGYVLGQSIIDRSGANPP